MTNSVDPDKTAGAVCSESTLFALSVMLGNYLPHTTSADVFSDAFFFRALFIFC